MHAVDSTTDRYIFVDVFMVADIQTTAIGSFMVRLWVMLVGWSTATAAVYVADEWFSRPDPIYQLQNKTWNALDKTNEYMGWRQRRQRL